MNGAGVTVMCSDPRSGRAWPNAFGDHLVSPSHLEDGSLLPGRTPWASHGYIAMPIFASLGETFRQDQMRLRSTQPGDRGITDCGVDRSFRELAQDER